MPLSSNPDNNYQIICHAFNDDDLTKVWDIKSNETNQCTHIIFIHATLNETHVTGFDDRYSDLITAFKYQSIKVGVTLGSMNFSSLSDRYGYLVRNDTARATFVNNAFEFLRRHNLDGFELLWRYPNSSSQGNSDDVEIFGQFVEQISHEFKQNGYFLGAYVIYSYEIFNRGENMARFSRNLDWITSGVKDFEGAPTTGTILHIF